MSTNPNPDFLSTEQFAAHTGLSVQTVRAWVRDKRLAAVKTTAGRGGKAMIPVSEVRRLKNAALASRVPDWSAQVDENDLLEVVPGLHGGRVAQSQMRAFITFKAVLDRGGDLEAALAALEPEPLSAAERARLHAEWDDETEEV